MVKVDGVMVKPAPLLVNEKVAAVATPGIVAETVKGPPDVALAVAVTLAIPEPLVLAVLLESVALAPLPAAVTVKVTVIPAIGLLLESLTMTASGLAKAALGLVDCVPPELTVIELEFICRTRVFCAVTPFASATWMTMLVDPEAVGVPEMTPVPGAIDKPPGRPEGAVQV